MNVMWLRSSALEVGVIAYGARIVSVRTPDRDGTWGETTLALADLDAYRDAPGYLGACVGRYANRIAGARFTLDGVEHRIRPNEGANVLHGGPGGFESVVWSTDGPQSSSVTLRHTSPDGDNGFPGTLAAAVTYTVTGPELAIEHTATTDKPTVVNLTNHTYWNLAGGGSAEDHEVQLHAGRVLPVNDESLPTGPPIPVDGTPLDFRSPARLGARIRDGHPQLRAVHGHDHNYVIDGPAGELRAAARVVEPRSGRTLELRTDQPGVQFYSANMLNGTLVLRDGSTARQTDAFCLEAQGFPDAPNHPDYPSTVLRPGEEYRSRMVFTFGTR
ncbi:aldose epimerase family protein [Pseudonocardia sp. DLS-67]